MKWRPVLIIAAVLFVYGLIHLYIGWHVSLFVLHVFDMHAPVLIGVIAALLAVSYPLARLVRSLLPRWLSTGLKVIGSYWMAVMMYVLLLLPLADLAALALAALSVEREVYVPLLGAAVMIAVMIIMLRGAWNAWQPIVRDHRITVPKKAGSRRTLTIAVASDLHLGAIVGNRHLQRLVDRIRQMEPDIILLPGDVIDDDIEPFLRHRMADTMKQLRAPLGVFAVLGNHEYYGGSIPRYIEEMEGIGIQVMLDETVKVEDNFYLVGRKDRTAEGRGLGGRKSAAELLADLSPDAPVIMMDHQPSELDKAAESGVDLLFSGHTHRGQLSPNHWITRRLFELDWGYLRKGRLHAFVSSGFGTWGPPVRIGSRCEILRVEVAFE